VNRPVQLPLFSTAYPPRTDPNLRRKRAVITARAMLWPVWRLRFICVLYKSYMWINFIYLREHGMCPLDRSIVESFARPGFEPYIQERFLCFFRSFQVNIGIVNQMRRVPLPSISLPIIVY